MQSNKDIYKFLHQVKIKLSDCRTVGDQLGMSSEEDDLEIRVHHRIQASQKSRLMGKNKPRCINRAMVYLTNTSQRCSIVSCSMYSTLVKLSLEHCV